MNITIPWHQLNLPKLVDQIAREGAVSLPILPENVRLTLLEEARRTPCQSQQEYLPSGVHEQLSSCYTFSDDSAFIALKRDCEQYLTRAVVPEKTFATPIVFNETVLQKYPAHTIGITPHRDYSRCRNLILVFLLGGCAPIHLCDDREGTNARSLDAQPGNLIVMRAGGFQGSGFRPFHFVGPVITERYTFALRQMQKK